MFLLPGAQLKLHFDTHAHKQFASEFELAGLPDLKLGLRSEIALDWPAGRDNSAIANAIKLLARQLARVKASGPLPSQSQAEPFIQLALISLEAAPNIGERVRLRFRRLIGGLIQSASLVGKLKSLIEAATAAAVAEINCFPRSVARRQLAGPGGANGLAWPGLCVLVIA